MSPLGEPPRIISILLDFDRRFLHALRRKMADAPDDESLPGDQRHYFFSWDLSPVEIFYRIATAFI
jgi:hypothetical protein